MDRLIYYKDNRSPKISRGLSSQATGDFDVTSDQTFRLRVRPLWGDEVVIDEQMTTDVDQDLVEYAPQPGDFATEGVYRAWIVLQIATGIEQDTDEFEIAVFAHSPGEGTLVGAVWRAARALAPVAWDGLRGYDEYGDPELQRVIELAKLRTFGRVVPVQDEDAQDPRVIDYIAKRVLVANVLPAAIDYWTNVVVSQTARTGSDEVKTYPDRIRAVEGQIVRFKADLDEQQSEVVAIIGSTPGVRSKAPFLINGGPMISPSLDELDGPFRPARYRRELW